MNVKNFDVIKKQYSFKNDTRQNIAWSWFKVSAIILEIIIFSSIVAEAIFRGITGNAEDVWFKCLNFFTQQSNLIVVFFLLTYCINSHLRIFKNNNLMIVVAAYITMTCLIFTFILIPIGLITKQYKHAVFYPMSVFNMAAFHIVNPIFMVAFFFLSIKQNRIYNSYEQNAWKFLFIGIAYPVCYCIYAIIDPFVFGHSVYGTITNLNTNLWLTIYRDGVAIQIHGNPYYIFIYLATILMFGGFIGFYHHLVRHKVQKNIRDNVLVNSNFI